MPLKCLLAEVVRITFLTEISFACQEPLRHGKAIPDTLSYHEKTQAISTCYATFLVPRRGLEPPRLLQR
jgi:hypothetical protein